MEKKYDVFICHSSQDKQLADSLCNYLEKHGLNCWIAPRNILPSENYSNAIIHGIESSKLMLVVFTRSANDSTFVHNEVERAFHNKLPILPFRRHDISHSKSLELFFSTTQWFDAIEGDADIYYPKMLQNCLTLLKFRKKTLKIGRSSANDIVINDATVSSQHALITILDSKELKIKDLNSTNGTYVNSKRIATETTISASDVIKLGNATLDLLKYLNPHPTPPIPNVIIDISIKQSKTIGNMEGNDIVLNHGDVSRQHAQLIEKMNGDIVIADSGSTNGTYVNGKKISVRVLQKGDLVMIANKYPLDWENILIKPQEFKPKKTFKTVLISATVFLVLAAAIGFFLIGKFGGEKPWTAEEIYAYYKKSVVMVEGAYYYQITTKDDTLYFAMVDDQPKIYEQLNEACLNAYTGTGFIISRDGKIVTNRHIVKPWEYGDSKQTAEQIKDFVKRYFTQISLTSRENYLKYTPLINEVKVEGKLYDEYFGIYLNDTHKSKNSKIPCHYLNDSGKDEIDVGLIQINSKTLPSGVENIISLDNAVLNDKGINVGKSIYTIGFPAGEVLAQTSQGLEANNQEGKITQTREDYNFGHNITIIGGASGSPVFDEYGKLIGIINAGFATGYNLAIKAKCAVELAK